MCFLWIGLTTNKANETTLSTTSAHRWKQPETITARMLSSSQNVISYTINCHPSNYVALNMEDVQGVHACRKIGYA